MLLLLSLEDLGKVFVGGLNFVGNAWSIPSYRTRVAMHFRRCFTTTNLTMIHQHLAKASRYLDITNTKLFVIVSTELLLLCAIS